MDSFKVFAHRINTCSIYFHCPNCWTNYKSNGERYKTAHNVIHKHGNDSGDISNRVETRTHHTCWNYPKNKKKIKNVEIYITDRTIRN